MNGKAKGTRNEHRIIRLLFRAPEKCRKLVHRWRDRERMPDVGEF